MGNWHCSRCWFIENHSTQPPNKIWTPKKLILDRTKFKSLTKQIIEIFNFNNDNIIFTLLRYLVGILTNVANDVSLSDWFNWLKIIKFYHF